MAWDSPLSALQDVVVACAGLEGAEPWADGGLDVERVVVAMPVELQTRTSPDGVVALGTAPPRQAAPTSVMPVLHRLRLTVEVRS